MKWKVINPQKLPKLAAIYRKGTMVYGPGKLYTNDGKKAHLMYNHPVQQDPEITHYLPITELLQEIESE